MKLRLSTSKVLTYRDCEYQYYLRYVLRISPEARAANLVFGGIAARVIHKIRAARHLGEVIDPVNLFASYWEHETQSQVIEYNSIQNANTLLETGKKLMELYPAVWDASHLTPLISEANEMLAEKLIFVDLGSGVIYRVKPDFVGMDMRTGKIAVVDEKTPVTPTDPEFALVSPQLTDYQMVVEMERHQFGLSRGIDQVGFLELIKRKVPEKKGKGPEVMAPVLVPARSQRQLDERRLEIMDVAADIRRGRFRKNQRQAHNTPCSLCDYKAFCWKGQRQGLVFPDGTKATQSNLAA